MEAERTPDVSCVVTMTMTMNCPLGHPRMTEKEQETCQPQLKKQLVCGAGTVKEQRRRLADEKHKTHDAGRSLVAVQHNLLS